MIAGLLMAAFRGQQPAPEVFHRWRVAPPAGVTLFRAHGNVGTPAELRALTDTLQRSVAPDGDALLVAADQEGGQLVGLGAETTPFAGPMALGAVGDAALAERVARATAREMRALGVNVNYAPVCDLATNPANPALGIRSFGDDPEPVAALVAATVRGLQAEGVAATAKHFPGAGEAAADSHHELPLISRPRDELLARELAPFRAAIAAGAQLVMAGHLAAPALSGDETTPATLSAAVMTDLLRGELGFGGVTITDALDMKALGQGEQLVGEARAALAAGNDLLLMTPAIDAEGELSARLAGEPRRASFSAERTTAALDRVARLRAWLTGVAGVQPSLDVVGCAEHQSLAAELARRAVTLVRDEPRLLPLRLGDEARITVVMPRPADLTPADTSSYVAPGVAAALRRRHPRVEELVTQPSPTAGDIGNAASLAARSDIVVLGTLSASLDEAQGQLARAVLAAGRPTITVALRTPWDLLAYPQASTHLCTYGVQPPSVEALAAVLFGEARAEGRLPVTLGRLYPRGHGLFS